VYVPLLPGRADAPRKVKLDGLRQRDTGASSVEHGGDEFIGVTSNSDDLLRVPVRNRPPC
jgi:hypothetical protein